MDVWADTLRLPHNIRTRASSRCNSQTTLYKYLHDTNYDSIGILLHGLPRFTTAPMEGVTEITGHPAISLNITSPTYYAIVFMYLIDLPAADCRRRYITEGLFRAAHRRISTATPTRYRERSRTSNVPILNSLPPTLAQT
jgi:hypothetical protein